MVVSENITVNYKRVAKDLYQTIKKQHRPNEMISSERELASRYMVSRVTMRKALELLEDDGVIKRSHGRGTFVVDPLQQGEFAIVSEPSLILESWGSTFYSKTAFLISEKIHGHNDKWKAKFHFGRGGSDGKDFPSTLDILERDVVKCLRGVFTFVPLYEVGKQLQQKNIPVILLGHICCDEDFAIDLDRKAFIKESLQHLQEVGCKTVGFLTSYEGPLLKTQEEYCDFVEYAVEMGFSVQEKWMPFCQGPVEEAKAYECFRGFLEQGDIPDGMIVYDEVLAQGALRAILHKQIRMPQQLRVISYSNTGVEFPCHLSVTRIELDLEQVAEIAVDAMIKLLKGQELEQKTIYLQGKLIKGQTT